MHGSAVPGPAGAPTLLTWSRRPRPHLCPCGVLACRFSKSWQRQRRSLTRPWTRRVGHGAGRALCSHLSCCFGLMLMATQTFTKN